MKQLKNYWVCVSNTGVPYTPSISYTRRQSIKAFLQDGHMTWEDIKNAGIWRCLRVNITFEEVTPKPTIKTNPSISPEIADKAEAAVRRVMEKRKIE